MKPFHVHAFMIGAVLFGGSLASAGAAPLQSLIPMHGVVLAQTSADEAIVRAYARKYGAADSRWTFLTGEPREVGRLLAQLGISSVHGSDHVTVAGDQQVGASDTLIDHSEPLVIIDKDGRIGSIIQNAAVSPSEIVAQARHDDGLASNSLKRFELAATSLVYSICGGFLVGEATVTVGFWILIIGIPLTIFALWQIWRRVFSDRGRA